LVQAVKFQVLDIRRHGDDKAVTRLKPCEPFVYKSGQYIELTFSGNEPRFYSIANAPGKDFIEIHIKDNMKGGAGTYAMRSLTIGESVEGRGPFGSCVFEKTVNDVVLIAGGMGISPLKAIIEEVINQKHAGAIRLYWGTNSADDLYIDAELNELRNIKNNFFYHHACTVPVTEKILEVESNLSHADIYIAGPPTMVAACIPVIMKKGARAESIHCDQRDLVESVISEMQMPKTEKVTG
jgi:propane monooxygenase reductase subunit